MNQEFDSGPAHYRLEDGCMYVSYTPNAVLTLADSKVTSVKLKELLGDSKLPFLVDTRNQKSVEKEAREYFVTEAAFHNAKAVALLTPTPVGRVIGNFFLSLNKPTYPVKLFSTKDEAMAWLGQFKDEENL